MTDPQPAAPTLAERLREMAAEDTCAQFVALEQNGWLCRHCGSEARDHDEVAAAAELDRLSAALAAEHVACLGLASAAKREQARAEYAEQQLAELHRLVETADANTEDPRP